MWSETGGRWGRRTWKLRRRQSGFPFRDKQRDFPWAICPVCGQEQYQEDLPLEEGRCLACRRRARKREEDAMTLREMSVEYRAQAQALESQIKAVPNVADIHFVTKEEALANFKANQERQDLFDNMESDTLRDRYEIHVVDIQLMQETVDQVKDIDGIAKVQASLEIADGFVMLRNVATALAIILVVMLVLISISIIANTIKLATFTRREEIAIMKMCGATNWFVRWPFLVEGMILGLTGGIIAFFCQWGIYGLIVKAIDQSDLLGIISTLPFSSMSHWILLVFLAAGFVIGAGGSVMAIRKFLKV